MQDKLLALKALAAAADAQSFTKGAAILGLSVSRVSRLIAELEKASGTRLLNRNSRHVTLSSEGEVFLEGAKKLLADFEKLFAARAGVSGQIRVAASIAFYDLQLSRILGEFMREHPEISIYYEVSSRPLDLIKEGFDIGFQEGHSLNEGYVAHYLGTIESCLCASPRYLQKYGCPQCLEDLSAHRLLSLDNCENTWHFRLGDECRDLEVKPCLMSNYSKTILEFCLDGCGIAFMPKALISTLAAEGRLEVVLPQYCGAPHEMYAVIGSRLNLSPLVRTLLGFVKKRMKG